jgi:hypothetical protein
MPVEPIFRVATTIGQLARLGGVPIACRFQNAEHPASIEERSRAPLF